MIAKPDNNIGIKNKLNICVPDRDQSGSTCTCISHMSSSLTLVFSTIFYPARMWQCEAIGSVHLSVVCPVKNSVFSRFTGLNDC